MAATRQTIANASGLLSEKIKHDHREIYQYYDMYTKSEGDRDAQVRWSNQLMWEVARHSIGEELVFYPLLEKHLGAKGHELAEHDRSDHQYVKDRLKKLESMTPGTEEFSALLKDTIDHLHEHADSEEVEDLPLLEAQLGSENSEKAAKSFMMTKMFVPTRAHPSAPDKPPFETIVGLLAAPLDHLKDVFAKFPTTEMKTAANEGQSDIRV